MRAVGLKVLKNKLREYVRLAASGETVLVTDGDKVVAELVPPRQERSLVLADVYLAEAVRKGWVTPPTLVSSVHHLAYPLRPWLKCFKASTRTAPSGDLPRHVCGAGPLFGNLREQNQKNRARHL